MPWWRKDGPSDDLNRDIAYGAQEITDAYEQSLVGLQQAFAVNTGQNEQTVDLAPVVGVTVQQYAVVCSAIDAAAGGNTRMVSIAQREGLTAEAWQQASTEWNARLMRSVEVAQAFFDAYPK